MIVTEKHTYVIAPNNQRAIDKAETLAEMFRQLGYHAEVDIATATIMVTARMVRGEQNESMD